MFSVDSLHSVEPVNVRRELLKGDAILWALDFQTLCTQAIFPAVGRRHPIPTEFGLCELDLRNIKNGTLRRSSHAPGAATGHLPEAPPLPRTSGAAYSFPPSLHNPGDRGSTWTARARTSHWIVDELNDHCGEDCESCYHHDVVFQNAYGKSKFAYMRDLGEVIWQR